MSRFNLKSLSEALQRQRDEASVARKCWTKCEKESLMCLYTPFVVALAGGNLKLDTFRHCMSQNIHFVKAFEKAYGFAEYYADDDNEKKAIRKLQKKALAELKMNHSFAQEWNIDVADQETKADSATSEYTKFLLATAEGKIDGMHPGSFATPFDKIKLAAYIVGAVAPCMRLYAFLGENLSDAIDRSRPHTYKKWIDYYSSKDSKALSEQIEKLLDQLTVAFTSHEIGNIEKLYQNAMKFLLDFFMSQPIVQATVVPLLKELRETKDHHLVIFSAFDLTWTMFDSAATLADLSMTSAPKSESDQNQSENQVPRMLLDDRKKMWSDFGDEYTDHHQRRIEYILRNTKEAEGNNFDFKNLRKALNQFSEVEIKSNARVSGSKILEGVNIEDIKRAGRQMILKDGCTDFFQSMIKNNVPIHVISYCWCADLVRATFSRGGGLDVINIHANELKYKDGITTGEIERNIESPVHKVEKFIEVLKDYGSNNRKFTVYIGDSLGDMLGLLLSDIGIVVGSSDSLKQVAKHFGVYLFSLFHLLVEKQRRLTTSEQESSSSSSTTTQTQWKKFPGTLFTVSSWHEIQVVFT